jgi:hypothetical protein
LKDPLGFKDLINTGFPKYLKPNTLLTMLLVEREMRLGLDMPSPSLEAFIETFMMSLVLTCFSLDEHISI